MNISYIFHGCIKNYRYPYKNSSPPSFIFKFHNTPESYTRLNSINTHCLYTNKTPLARTYILQIYISSVDLLTPLLPCENVCNKKKVTRLLPHIAHCAVQPCGFAQPRFRSSRHVFCVSRDALLSCSFINPDTTMFTIFSSRIAHQIYYQCLHIQIFTCTCR